MLPIIAFDPDFRISKMVIKRSFFDICQHEIENRKVEYG